MIYFYQTFGLNIQSELELPELLPSTNNKVDVEIMLGKCPLALSNCLKKRINSQIGSNEYLFEILNVAQFYITDGNKVIVEPKGKKSYDKIRLFILGTCLGVILHQRQILPLHASAIVHQGKAVLFVGKSGTGKSTLATAFRLKGYKIITDDVCPIKIIDGEPFAIPGYPQIKLCEDIMKNFEIAIDQHKFVREGIGKRAVRFQKGFATNPIKIKTIYFLIYDEFLEKVEIVPQNNSKKLLILKENVYRKNILKGMNQQVQMLNVASIIANNTTIKKIRKTKVEPLQNTIEAIDRDL